MQLRDVALVDIDIHSNMPARHIDYFGSRSLAVAVVVIGKAFAFAKA